MPTESITVESKQRVFTIDGYNWLIRLSNGTVAQATWNSKGAAEAGLQVEERRLAIRANAKANQANNALNKYK